MSRPVAIVLTFLLGVTLAAVPGTATAADSPEGRTVADQPANGTPHVLDGRVNSIAEVGDTMILGGSFSQTRNDSSQSQIARSNLMAFNSTTGQITPFAPNPNGEITTVIPAGDGQSVYVAGGFSSIGGVSRSNVARVRVSDGAVIQAFNAGTVSGRVRDLRLVDGRLWLAGAFTHVGGRAQGALATVNPTTGAFSDFMTTAVTGVHNGGVTNVAKIDVTPQSDRLVAVGNFSAVGGVTTRQLAMLDVSGSSAQPSEEFNTSFYAPPCLASAFDTYVRDLDFSPDGSFFVVSTTGAYGGSTGPCDTTARFETRATGVDVQPSWIDYTGGDTTYAVEITDSAVYTGGHARWQNNPFAGDVAGQGAVERPGIAALDPSNGLPLSWNPTRTRGIGVFDFLVTSRGLWVGSDTDRIGSFRYKGRIAVMPLAGATIPANTTPTLPNDVYTFGAFGAASDPRFLYRVNAGGQSLSAAGGIDWSADTNESPSSYHNRVGNRAEWGSIPTVDATVPLSTPRAVFENELWDPAGGQEQSWDFPVEAGVPVQVRLYFSNRCTCTQQPGQRQFDVDVDGTRVLDDFDIAAAVGHDVGTMRAFDITSDGNVDIDLLHAVENPLINGIEILRTDLAPNAVSPIAKHTNDGTGFGARTPVDAGGIDWNSVRGGFMLRGQLYLAHNDGTFTRRSFDGSSYGNPEPVDTADELVVLANWRSDISRMTGMFFDSGRIYYTLSGSDTLYYRYFTPESDVVGAKQLVVGGNVAGISYSQVRGMFTTGDDLYWATPDGTLNRMDWAEGAQSDTPVAGTATPVSGPAIDGHSWSSRGLFLYQDPNGNAAGLPPVADITYSCVGLDCQFNSSNSTSPGTTIAQRSWQFGDGSTSSATNPSHVYGSAGTRTVTLTIRTANGKESTTTREVTVERVNQPPTAAFQVDCDQLICDFDASASSDPDGDQLTYDWDFGDGATGTGETTSHTYSSGGTRTATLTVSDGQLSAQTSRQVAVSESTSPEVDFVGAATTSGNRSVHSVQIPASVRAGDQLLLFITSNSSATALSTPTGWTLEESSDGNGIRGRAWARTATAEDGGSTVTVTSAAFVKSSLSISAYRSTTGSASVTASASAVNNSAGTNHTAPDVTVAQSGSWVTTYWGEKSGTDTVWSAPGTVARTTGAATGPGKTSGLLGDTGTGVSTGTRPGATATTSTSVGRSVLFSVVVAPGSDGPANRAPVASFDTSCAQLACDFDASASSDPDGDALTYAWDFGDGDSATGQTADHTYASAGTRTATLTVSDGQLSAQTSRQVTVSEVTSVEVDHLGAASTSGNRSLHSVQVPTSVQPGDQMLLFITANSTTPTLSAPDGWTQVETRDGNTIRAVVWARTAVAGDAGTTVTVTSSAVTKATVTVGAYRSNTGSLSVAASAAGGINGAASSHTAPSVEVAAPGSWVVSYWSEKSGVDTTWSAPTSAARATSAGTNSGKTSALLGDSNAGVSPGTWPGATATTSTSVGRSLMFSIVLAPQ